MTRQDKLNRIKRQIRMGIYETDEKWKAVLEKLVHRIWPERKAGTSRPRKHQRMKWRESA
jgi:hypothetical protein